MTSDPMPYKHFGEWVKRARNEKEWSQAKLAGRAFCSIDAIRKIEQNRNEYRPSLDMVARLAECLEIPLAHRAQFIACARANGADKNGEIEQSLRKPAELEAAPAPADVIPDTPITVARVIEPPKQKRLLPQWGIAGVILTAVFGFLFCAGLVTSTLFLVSLGNRTSAQAETNSGFLSLVIREPRVTIEADGKLVSNGATLAPNTRVTIRFGLQNPGGQSVALSTLEVGARGPCTDPCTWSSTNFRFSPVQNLVLQPNEIFTYEANRIFTEPGHYFVEPVIQDKAGKWGGIQPFTRIEFTVAE